MKKIVSLLLVLILCVALIGCAAKTQAPSSSDAADAKSELIGIVLPTKEESRWLNDQKYFNEIFGSDYNYEILFSQNNSATEKTNVETLISKGAKIIVLCSYDATASAAAVNDAKKEGITVISYDRLIMGTDKLDYYVTFDSCSVGKAQAEYLIQQAGSEKGINLYLTGLTGGYDSATDAWVRDQVTRSRPVGDR